MDTTLLVGEPTYGWGAAGLGPPPIENHLKEGGNIFPNACKNLAGDKQWGWSSVPHLGADRGAWGGTVVQQQRKSSTTCQSATVHPRKGMHR